MYFIRCFAVGVAIFPTIARCGVDISDFVSFGPNIDHVLAEGDDNGVYAQTTGASFSYSGKSLLDVYVNTNGHVSFCQHFGTFTPECSQGTGVSFIAPFWADVDTRFYSPGRVYYRESYDSAVLSKVTGEARAAFSNASIEKMNWAFVATWDRVTFLGAIAVTPTQIWESTTVATYLPENTFQLVLTSNDQGESYAIFYYNKITWTSGDDSGGDSFTGLGGDPASAGFYKDVGINNYILLGSCQNDVVNLDNMTNCNYPGKFVFRIDGQNILVPGNEGSPDWALKTAPSPGCYNSPPTPSTLSPATMPPTTTTSPVCSSHGHCTCDYGYKGDQCEIPIDFCNQRMAGTATLNYQACEPNGRCVSVEAVGFECICDSGFYGTFCDSHDDSRLTTTRCLAYAPSLDVDEASTTPTPTAEPIPVGCPATEENEACVPDDLNCLLDRNCPYPVGWCIPRITHLLEFVANLASLKGV